MSDPRFRRSAGEVTSLGSPVVWCPKHRRRVLGGRVAPRPNQLLDEISADNGWQVVAREVLPDQVHIFVPVRPTDSPAQVVGRFKGRRTRVLRAGYATAVRRSIQHQWDQVA
jgi:putative transposase